MKRFGDKRWYAIVDNEDSIKNYQIFDSHVQAEKMRRTAYNNPVKLRVVEIGFVELFDLQQLELSLENKDD